MALSRRRFLGLGAVAAAGIFMTACSSEGGGAASSASDQPNASRASMAGTSVGSDSGSTDRNPSSNRESSEPTESGSLVRGRFEQGSQIDRGFEVDDMLRDTTEGDIHFSLHVPDAYDGSTPYALYVHCPGYEGLWFQGAGANLQEDFVFQANDYIADMIVVSPQLDDWDDTSARKTIELTQWMLAHYTVDAKRVYLSGYSGGGETISRVLGMQPQLYRRALHLSSQWDGDTEVLVKAQVPVRMSIGADDEYYGSGPVKRAYKEIRSKYRAAGLSDGQIKELLVRDVKPAGYFDGFQADSYREHAGGAALFSHDEVIMGWLFR